jgi:TatD DNase family protein
VITPLRELAQSLRVAAIGETGLDYHHLPSATRVRERMAEVVSNALQAETEGEIEGGIRDGALKSKQASIFQQQLDLAIELKLNVVIHQRDAWDDTLAILREYGRQVSGVFHCFGGTREQAEEVISLGHLVSFTGIVTFKNGASVRETAAKLSLGEFMVETDCPYLAPEPHRGKRCEPAYTRLVAESIAQARGISVEEVARATTATAEEFFRLAR